MSNRSRAGTVSTSARFGVSDASGSACRWEQWWGSADGNDPCAGPRAPPAVVVGMIGDVLVCDRDECPGAQARTAERDDRSDEVLAEEYSQLPQIDPRPAAAYAYRTFGDFQSGPGAFSRNISPVLGDPAALESGAVEAILLFRAVIQPRGRFGYEHSGVDPGRDSASARRFAGNWHVVLSVIDVFRTGFAEGFQNRLRRGLVEPSGSYSGRGRNQYEYRCARAGFVARRRAVRVAARQSVRGSLYRCTRWFARASVSRRWLGWWCEWAAWGVVRAWCGLAGSCAEQGRLPCVGERLWAGGTRNTRMFTPAKHGGRATPVLSRGYKHAPYGRRPSAVKAL